MTGSTPIVDPNDKPLEPLGDMQEFDVKYSEDFTQKKSFVSRVQWTLIGICVLVFVIFAVVMFVIVIENIRTKSDDISSDDNNPPPIDGKLLTSILDRISPSAIRAHLQYLSSNLLLGRGTGTVGEKLAVAYISTQFAQWGSILPFGNLVIPANGSTIDNGGYIQNVPLFGSIPADIGNLDFTSPEDEQVSFEFVQDFVVGTDLEQDLVEIHENSITFIGYGIHAPEAPYNWDDYKNFNATGKVLIGLVNDPPATDEEPSLFLNETLTYYGRWMYKFEEARRQGAKAIFLVHTLEMAGYPWSVLSNGGQTEDVSLQNKNSQPGVHPLWGHGWLTSDAAARLAELCGTTLQSWMTRAATRGFTAVEYEGVRVALRAQYNTRAFMGSNVVGLIPGTVAPNELIVFTSHHDHLGIKPEPEGGGEDPNEDRIYNGAVDNASGVALLLALAEAFHSAQLERSVVFVTVTAEEKGLIGSKYFAESIPARYTVVANLNYDGTNLWGETTDIAPLFDPDYRAIEPLLVSSAARENLTVSPDPEPGQGHFFRSDQLSFARLKIPAADLSAGCQYKNQPPNYCKQIKEEYRMHDYHQVSDEYHSDWTMDGVLQQGRVGARMAYSLAADATYWLDDPKKRQKVVARPHNPLY